MHIVGWMRIVTEEKVQSNNCENRSIKLKKNRKRSKKAPMPSPTLVQRLFQICVQVFAGSQAGTVPPPKDVQRLRLVLDSMKPEDVGLTMDMPFFRTIDVERVPPITYFHIYECNKFSMGIFCLPPSGVIPLHNHPGMTVFSKLLFGSMHIKSYDWVDNPHTATDKANTSYVQPAGVRLAKVKVDSVFTAPCNTSILYPNDGGNMHCFTAVTACAVLDVLGPPYSDPEGRHCTYYRDFPYEKLSGLSDTVEENDTDQYVWLEDKEKPNEFNVVGAMYRGPRVVK